MGVRNEILVALGFQRGDGSGLNQNGDVSTGATGGDLRAVAGNAKVETVGRGLQVKGGANPRIGRALLAGGTAVVPNTTVTAATRVFVTHEGDGGAVGFLHVDPAAYVVGVSFSIVSSNGADAGHVLYLLVEEL